MSRNVRIPEGRHRVRALPPEPSDRGERISVGLLLGAIFVLLLAIGYLLTMHAPRVAGPINGALS